MNYPEEKYQKWLDAFRDEELECVTFYAVTRQDGEKKKLIEFKIAVDWDEHREQVKLTPDVTLADIPEHKKGVMVTINVAVDTYLELFEYACDLFPDCTTEAWYLCSKDIRADEKTYIQTCDKLGLAYGSTPLRPYSDDVNENSYDAPELSELKSRITTYF